MMTSGSRSLIQGKIMAENSHGFVLLQRGSFFDDCILTTQSVVFINQSFVVQFLCITMLTILSKLIKAAINL